MTFLVTFSVFAFGLASVAVILMVLLPFSRINGELKLPVELTVTGLPFTVTESIPLVSVAVPLTEISFVLNTWLFIGWVTINNGGVVSGAGGGV